jgi:hypothetical protein
MAMWTANLVGGQTVFELDHCQRKTSVSRLMRVLKQVCKTTCEENSLDSTSVSLDVVPRQSSAVERLECYECQEDTLSLRLEEPVNRTSVGKRIENALGRITHSLDGRLITFEPRSGGAVIFELSNGRVKISATAPDGTTRNYPATRAAFEAAQRICEHNVNWLGGRHFSFEPSYFSYKNQAGKVQLTISQIEYCESGFVKSFTMPSGERWRVIKADYFECLDGLGKRKSALPLKLGPIVLKSDGLYAYGIDASFDIGVPFKLAGGQPACSPKPNQAVALTKSITASIVGPICSAARSAWCKPARERHLQSVASLLNAKKALANRV